MRDVAVVSFAHSTSPKEVDHNEVEMIVPVVREAVAASGIPREEIGFTCSGSLDYLQGGPFSFVMGLDAVGAWPPIRESHVEMDGAWALYEAWVAIQTGEVDSALVYGFGKASQGDVHEIMTLQYDPYYMAPLWPSMVDVAALQARAYLDASGRTERDLAEVAAAALRAGAANDRALRSDAAATADALLAQPKVADPLRASDIFPTTDGAAAIVLAADDLARKVSKRPAWIRGLDHRIEPHSLGTRDLARSESTAIAARAAGVADGPIDVAEVHAQFSHEVLILAEALGVDPATVNPSGGPLVANGIMSAGLVRIGEVARRIIAGEANRGVAHVTSGPALQQNLVCVLEGE
jgi:acetyl-CoA acetyltransferase